MSQKKLTHWQMMWYKAVHLTIANEQRLTLGAMDAAQKGYEALLWRLGYNLYNAGAYEEAMGLLERVTEMDARKVKKEKSVVHQTAGRCAVQMFRESGEHKHLEVAYRYYSGRVVVYSGIVVDSSSGIVV
jgi:tetratricopeptide (TPR) repeat protein